MCAVPPAPALGKNPEPIQVEDEQPPLNPVSSEATRVISSEDGGGDPLAADAPVRKKGRTEQWKEAMIGTVPVLVNAQGTLFRCPIEGCSFENEQERSATVHVARHRKRLQVGGTTQSSQQESMGTNDQE
jgi:hypothetical protein